MQYFLIFIFGLLVGATIGIFIMALFNISKQGDLEHEKQMAYKDGYQKGFDAGYDFEKSRTK